MAQSRISPKTPKPVGVAFSAVQYQGLTELAVKEGHLSRSKIVKRLVDAELNRQFGRNWEDRFDPNSDRLEAA